MPPGLEFLAFLGVVLLGAVSPGPDFVVMTRVSAVAGRKAGMACGLGVACGVFVWAVAIAFGVVQLVAASTIAFTVVKLAGAGYLVYLGVRSWLSVKRGDGTMASVSEAPAIANGVAFRTGLLCDLLNPKIAMFYLALIPQFLPADPGLGPTLVLAVVAALVNLAWNLLLATVVGALRGLVTRSRVRRALDAVTGTVLVGLGVRVAAQTT